MDIPNNIMQFMWDCPPVKNTSLHPVCASSFFMAPSYTLSSGDLSLPKVIMMEAKEEVV